MMLGAMRWALAGLVLCVLLAPGSEAAAQKRPVRIGGLTASWGPTPNMVGLRDGLVDLGYRENEDFVIGVRFTQGDMAALDVAARQLVQYGVDLIVVTGGPAAKAAQNATSTIPIVFGGGVGDPVAIGLVRSMARPGGNITGVTDLDLELAPKRLELLRDLVPEPERVLLVYDRTDWYTAAAVARYREAARRLRIALVEEPVGTGDEVRSVLAAFRRSGGDGILAPMNLALNIPGLILEATKTHGVPTMFPSGVWVEQGALAAYGPDLYESGRQVARIVDKILKGVKPGDIPVETNPKIEFALNVEVAEVLGLTLPPHMVFRANKLVR